MFLSVVISHTHTHTQCLCISLSVGIKHACFSFVLFVDVVHTDMLTVSFVYGACLWGWHCYCVSCFVKVSPIISICLSHKSLVGDVVTYRPIIIIICDFWIFLYLHVCFFLPTTASCFKCHIDWQYHSTFAIVTSACLQCLCNHFFCYFHINLIFRVYNF